MPETLVHSFADVVVIRIYYIFCFYVVIKWRRQATMVVAIESFTASDDEANFWFVHPCQAFIPAIHPSIVNHILCHTMCVRTNQREWFLYITFFTFLFLHNFLVFFNIFPVVELVERLLLLFLHHFMFSSWLKKISLAWALWSYLRISSSLTTLSSICFFTDFKCFSFFSYFCFIFPELFSWSLEASLL